MRESCAASAVEVTLASEGWSVLSEVIDFTVIEYESPQQGHVQGPGEGHDSRRTDVGTDR